MLNTLRGSISGWTAKILLGLLVLSFAVWGIGDVFRGGVANAVLTAGETEVSLQDYALAYNRAQSRLAQQIGRRPTAEEAEMIRSMGCNKIQGYHFGRPMPAAEARQVFEREEARRLA